MMIIPDLARQSAAHRHRTIRIIQGVLYAYRKVVVFADLNLHLNVLWISVRPGQGVCLELAAILHTLIPEAKLVAQTAGPQ